MAFEQRLKPLHLTRLQWCILATVFRHDEQGITQTELARELELRRVALGLLIDRLEERGLTARRADGTDRRKNRVLLTRKGHAVFKETAEIGMKMNSKVMRGISPEQQQALISALHEMKANLLDSVA